MRLSWAIIFITLLLFGAGCRQKEAVKQKQEAEVVIPVKVSEVALKDMDEELEYVGSIKAYDEAVVYPKVSGKIVEKLKNEGEAVGKGEAICYVDRDEVGLTFEKAPVESPLAGVLGKIYVDIGANVTSLTPVALVINMDKVKIILDLPEKYLPRVSLGQEATVTVDAYPGQEFSGKITKIPPIVDTQTRSIPVEIVLDNPDHRLNSGMFARIRLVIQQHTNVAAVLKESVMGRGEDSYAYIVENKKAVLKKVIVGTRKGAYIEIKEGLKPGEKVVIMGQQRLKDGSQVAPQEE